jgi:hypothetical protein
MTFKQTMENIAQSLEKFDWQQTVLTVKHLDDDYGNTMTEVNFLGNKIQKINVKNPHTKIRFNRDGQIIKQYEVDKQ